MDWKQIREIYENDWFLPSNSPNEEFQKIGAIFNGYTKRLIKAAKALDESRVQDIDSRGPMYKVRKAEMALRDLAADIVLLEAHVSVEQGRP